MRAWELVASTQTAGRCFDVHVELHDLQLSLNQPARDELAELLPMLTEMVADSQLLHHDLEVPLPSGFDLVVRFVPFEVWTAPHRAH